MATDADNLDLALSNCAANLEYITRKPRPEYTVEGATYTWGQLFKLFSDQMATIRVQRQAAEAPFCVTTFGC